jgi:NUDIX domain
MIVFAAGTVLGTVLGAACSYFIVRQYSTINEIPADDDCQSLFYDSNIDPTGKGLPIVSTCSSEVKEKVYTVKPEFKFLPRDFYAQAVEFLPTVCVDIMCRRKCDGKLLLFFRRDKPAAKIWWWPGGRAFRGETFFQTAIRKTADETGADPKKITAKAVVQTWNTFFPDSSWDQNRKPGYEGCQTVNIMVFCEIDADDVHIAKETKDMWAVESHRWISPEEGLVVGAFDKYVRLNILHARKAGLL